MGFLQATSGSLKIDWRTCAVSQLTVGAQAGKDENGECGDEAETSEPQPTNILIVRGLPVDTERLLFQAFSVYAPRIKKVEIPRTCSGKPRNHAFIHFYEIHEASSASSRLRDAGNQLGGRRANVDYMVPQTVMESFEAEVSREKAQKDLKSSHQQALSGVNGNMWASYLAMFESGQVDGGSQAKRQRV